MSGAPLDIGDLLDRGPWTRFQKQVVGLAAAAVIVDGFDSQLIGFAIPVLIREWGLTRGDFSPVVAGGLIGMSAGSMAAGYVGDWLGRRRAVIGSVLLFGLATGAIGAAPNLPILVLLRLVAGLGIGGALPSATTLSAECTPARWRTVAVTSTILCVPLGGMLAGLFSGYVLPHLGWRALFLIGGALPIALVVVLVRTLPESPRFLARQPPRWPELVILLRRMSRPASSDAAFVDATEQHVEGRPGVAAVFAGGRARDTLALWSTFFLCLLAVYTAFSWLPTMLTAEGLNVATAGSGLTAYNLGGVLGALMCALAIARFGSRWPLALCAAGGCVSALLLRGVDVANTVVLIVGLGIHGLFVNAVQSTLFAVCAYVYPTKVRATGTASALAFGRIGAILSAFAGAAVISAGGADAYFTLLALAMSGVFVGLVVVRHHIPGR